MLDLTFHSLHQSCNMENQSHWGENGVKTKQIDKMSTEDVLAEIPVHPLGTDTYESCYSYVSGMTSS